MNRQRSANGFREEPRSLILGNDVPKPVAVKSMRGQLSVTVLWHATRIKWYVTNVCHWEIESAVVRRYNCPSILVFLFAQQRRTRMKYILLQLFHHEDLFLSYPRSLKSSCKCYPSSSTRACGDIIHTYSYSGSTFLDHCLGLWCSPSFRGSRNTDWNFK